MSCTEELALLAEGLHDAVSVMCEE